MIQCQRVKEAKSQRIFHFCSIFIKQKWSSYILYVDFFSAILWKRGQNENNFRELATFTTSLWSQNTLKLCSIFPPFLYLPTKIFSNFFINPMVKFYRISSILVDSVYRKRVILSRTFYNYCFFSGGVLTSTW